MQSTTNNERKNAVKEKIPQPEVLAWLASNYPSLHALAEIERNWIWLAVDLRGEENKATRDAIGVYGFRFAGRGHPLASGKTGTWSHSCEKPMPYKGKGRFKGKSNGSGLKTDNKPDVDPDVLAFLNS